MISKEIQFIQRVTTRMMEEFLSALNSEEFEEVYSNHFSCVVKSVLSSFTATMMHTWCVSVTSDDQIYKDLFVEMLHDIFTNVMSTTNEKDQTNSYIKHEVH